MMRYEKAGNIRYLILRSDREPFCAHVVNETVQRHKGEALADFKNRCQAVEAELFAEYGTLEAIQGRFS